MAVSNTSPLSNLAIIDRLELLREQFSDIPMPEAVRVELGRLEHDKARERLRLAEREVWLRVRLLSSRSMSELLSGRLDRGESEAIALAIETKADWLLMDERDGRLVARQAGLRLTGVLGILMRAKLLGRIPSLRQEIAELRSRAHFFVKSDLESKILANVGEGV